MPATITFYGNQKLSDSQDLLDHNTGSGIGFFGSSFGVPVPLTESQQTTWVTDELGRETGNQLNNNQYVTEGDTTGLQGGAQGTVKINGADAINLSRLPNHKATLNIRFEYTEPVVCNQPSVVIYDRDSIENHAVDVITYVYECRHPQSEESAPSLSHRAKTTFTWTTFNPRASDKPTAMLLTNSPGPSGLNTSPADTAGSYGTFVDTELGEANARDNYNKEDVGYFMRHDWFVALSSSPIEIGQKASYGLYFTVDYLPQA